MELFAFRLCLALGDTEHPHPDYLLERLTYAQLLDWMDYYAAEPWGETRADMRAAANTMWTLSPYTESDPPNLNYPYHDDQSPEAFLERAKAVKEYIRRKYGNQHQQTRDHAHGGHVGADDRADPCASGH